MIVSTSQCSHMVLTPFSCYFEYNCSNLLSLHVYMWRSTNVLKAMKFIENPSVFMKTRGQQNQLLRDLFLHILDLKMDGILRRGHSEFITNSTFSKSNGCDLQSKSTLKAGLWNFKALGLEIEGIPKDCWGFH